MASLVFLLSIEMENRFMRIGFVVCLTALMSTLSACGTQPSEITSMPVPTNTVDLCSADALPSEVEKIHKHMREFDDASLLAANAPLDQLTTVITEMQKIRRDTEDQVVPTCLADLKRIQLAHMNTVIETTVAFLGGTNPEILREGILLSRQQHNQYAVEYARLLGLTVVVLPTSTPVASGTEAPSSNSEVYMAVNSSANDVPLYSEPSENAQIVAVLLAGGSVRILSQSADGQWLSVELSGQPGQVVWLKAVEVTVTAAP